MPDPIGARCRRSRISMKLSAGAIALSVLGGGGGVLWSVAGWRAVHAPLERPLELALASALHLDPDAISVKRVHLAFPARLVIDELSTGELAASQVMVDVDPGRCSAARCASPACAPASWSASSAASTRWRPRWPTTTRASLYAGPRSATADIGWAGSASPSARSVSRCRTARSSASPFRARASAA